MSTFAAVAASWLVFFAAGWILRAMKAQEDEADRVDRQQCHHGIRWDDCPECGRE